MAALRLGDIRAEWDAIRPGLVRVLARAGADWRPEDVYAACVTGAAHLYLGEGGFVVVRPETMPSGRRALLVWVAFSGRADGIRTFQPALDALARDHGFEVLTCWSRRRGFDRLPGWRRVCSVYERCLDDL